MYDNLRDPLYPALVEFQIERLKRTYRDFVEDRQYGLLAKFFFEDVYSTRDKAARDEQVQRLRDRVREALGEEAAGNLERVIRLNELTDRLDDALLKKMRGIGVDGSFTESEYEEAYYLSDNYEERVEQIMLILASLKYFHGLSQYRSIGFGLKLLRPYAIVKRATVLLDFLQAGYKAFRSVRSLDSFHDEVRDREMERLDRIYALGRRVPTLAELQRRAREMGIRDADRKDMRQLMREMAQWV